MASEVDICNDALTHIGHSQIASLNQAGKAAELCQLHYPRRRDSLLRSHTWNFAIGRSTLAQSSVTPNHEYTYYHVLPVDCLKVIRTNWEANGISSTAVYGFPGINGYQNEVTPYRVEHVPNVGTCIATNESTVKIEYVKKVTDPARFDPLFQDCLALSLATKLCMPLTDNAALFRTLKEDLAMTLRNAMTMDAQEGTPREVVDVSPWIRARG